MSFPMGSILVSVQNPAFLPPLILYLAAPPAPQWKVAQPNGIYAPPGDVLYFFAGPNDPTKPAETRDGRLAEPQRWQRADDSSRERLIRRESSCTPVRPTGLSDCGRGEVRHRLCATFEHRQVRQVRYDHDSRGGATSVRILGNEHAVQSVFHMPGELRATDGLANHNLGRLGMDSSNDTGRRKLAQKRAAALRPDPLPRQGGSAAHRSQQNLSRTLGQDPLTSRMR